MIPRNRVAVDRQITVANNVPYETSVSPELMQKALDKMKPDESIISLERASGHVKSAWGMDDEEVWYDQTVIIVRSFRDETDEEYSSRMQVEEYNKKQAEERERLEYLRLKAKFEP